VVAEFRIALDPWLRIHPDDVERGTVATLVRGSRQMSPTVAGLDVATRFALETRPAAVQDVGRDDEGNIASLVVRDDGHGDGELVFLDWRDRSNDKGAAPADGRPFAADGWSIVVGELPVQRLHRLAIVIDPGTFKHWGKFGVWKDSFRADYPRNVDVVIVTNESVARAHTFDEFRIMGKPDKGLVDAVRARVRPSS